MRERLASSGVDYPTLLVALAKAGELAPWLIFFFFLNVGHFGAWALVLACGVSLLSGILLKKALAPLNRVEALLAGAQRRGERSLSGWHLVRWFETSVSELQRREAEVVALTAEAIPPQVRLLGAMENDIREGVASSMLGLLRLADGDRLASLDVRQSAEALDAFSLRVKSAIDPKHVLIPLDRATFAVWFRQVTPEQGAGAMRAIVYALCQDIETSQGAVRPRVFAGGAVYPKDSNEAAQLLSLAQASLAESRDCGGLTLFSEEAQAAARKRYLIEQEIAGAVARQELALHFQPLVDLREGRLVGAEALLRWNHPELGWVPPSVFVPIIEGTHYMDEIGLWVLNSACRQARLWKDSGLQDIRVAINLSARQLRNPALGSTIVRTLERHRLEPKDIELELTETATMDDAVGTLELFSELHAIGVGLAIDDFGSGYSSLSYLKTLPFTKLKIDREFVTQIHMNPTSSAICGALIQLANALSLRVLAEGVETHAEVERLRSLGCDMFQGYFFGKPMDADAFALLVEDEQWKAQLSCAVRRSRQDICQRIA